MPRVPYSVSIKSRPLMEYDAHRFDVDGFCSIHHDFCQEVKP